MPLYEYNCESCKNKFTLLRTYEDRDKEIRCPKCNNKTLKRAISSFSSCSAGQGHTHNGC